MIVNLWMLHRWEGYVGWPWAICRGLHSLCMMRCLCLTRKGGGTVGPSLRSMGTCSPPSEYPYRAR